MDTDPPPETRATATATFERELETLLVDAFARGAAVENTWDVTVPVSDAPDWSVTIEKRKSDDRPSYDPTCLDE